MEWPPYNRGPAVPLPVVILGAVVAVVVLWSFLDGDDDPADETTGSTDATPGAPATRPSSAAVSLPDPTATPLLAGGTYEVVAGDSAWLIAEKLAVPADVRAAWVAEFLALNGVEATELQIGESVILPPFEGLSPDAVPDDAGDEPAEAEQESPAEEESPAEGTQEQTDDEAPEASEEEEDGDDDGSPSRSGGASIQVDAGGSASCSSIDGLTYCLGSDDGWSCTDTGSGLNCSGPSGQSTTCTGGDNAITCEGASGESLTCVDTGSSTVCSSNSTGTDETSDSNSQNCTRLGSATFCFGSSND